ncbi:hypothetical protein CYLTODRAFT_364601 [Cylindrobasidium torrendii FP15055 ss-10]|uniref:Zona occludens toxin N-terminal domain-containing protein n=1 Tax=Cylindrobasidium torrendii FP15055 ss-10 TaxID=1314674 RepID=A0A0D7BUV5_9AGAR|nr:hypothetical protein CYLTODRAFT_364601 [Cylindrobasidium torrendii FP15055 ss-10]
MVAFKEPVAYSDNELSLLEDAPDDNATAASHGTSNAPVFSKGVLSREDGLQAQYGLLGKALTFHQTHVDDINKPVYMNTNAPLSSLVCGVQGSGKSHTVGVMLENMLVRPSANAPIGKLEKPLCGLVLYYGQGGPTSLPCEAAYIACSSKPDVVPPEVKVYVSSSSYNTLRRVYAAVSPRIIVEPLMFDEKELDAEAFLSLMAVGGSPTSMPLYMNTVMDILRTLGDKFTFTGFKNALASKQRTMNTNQLSGLDQRLSLLTSLVAKGKQGVWSRFNPGQLTIIDLSDPFVDHASAASLFEILIRLFVRENVGTGKVLLVDEAHKYLSEVNAGLVKGLVGLIREQRHYAMRVIISTQEPTVIPPVIIELCSVVILHRFSSPAWWEHLKKRVPAELDSAAFDKVVRLKTGHAIMLSAPSLFLSNAGVVDLGRGYVVMRVRQRVTVDGGASVMVQ